MLPVVTNPPERPTLRGRRAGKRTGELDDSADFESAVGEAAVVERGYAEGSDGIGDERHDQREPTPTDEEEPYEREMAGYERSPETPRPTCFRDPNARDAAARVNGHSVDPRMARHRP
jgi:hypothetical protein